MRQGFESLRYFAAFSLCFFAFVFSGAYADVQGSIPRFDTLRFEGEKFTITGHSAASRHIELVKGAHIVGEGETDAQGNFTIDLVRKLTTGEYRFVLRATGQDGRSVTSMQTLIVTISENAAGDILALVEEPGKGNRLLAGQIRADSGAVAPEYKNFAVERIDFAKGQLAVCGESPADMRVFVSLAGRSIGSERSRKEGGFCVIREVALEKGDYILQIALFDDTGAEKTAVSLPFTLAMADRTHQFYRGGQAVDSVVVKRGETLSRLARRVYGNAAMAGQLFEANRNILQTPDKISPGMELVVPRQEKQK